VQQYLGRNWLTNHGNDCLLTRIILEAEIFRRNLTAIGRTVLASRKAARLYDGRLHAAVEPRYIVEVLKHHDACRYIHIYVQV
jgi:hypothetical protein